MKRISTATKVVDKFGAGKPGFTNGNAVTGVASTDLEADWFDHLQEEVANVVESSGGVPDGSAYTQLMTALKSMFSGVVGSARNLNANIAVGTTANFTADEVVVESALSGLRFCLGALNASINLATVGAGGMDTGAAPVNGYVAIYAIFNPATNTRALLGRNATAAKASEVYSGVNMPAGFVASSLLAVVPTNASGQFVLCNVVDRNLTRVAVAPLIASGTLSASFISLIIASAVPLNARRVGGYCEYTNSVAANISMSVAASAAGVGGMKTAGVITTNGQPINIPFFLDLQTAQTLFYATSVSSGSPSFTLAISSYEI